jgi:hypothetical protein
MSEFNFYFSDKDIEELFNFIQLKGGVFVPDVFFEEENHKSIYDYDEFFNYQRSQTVHFFLLAEVYSFEPLKVTKNRFTKDAQYNVNQRKGGPYIDFSFYRGYSIDAIIPYKMSTIEMYSRFIHIDSTDEFAVSKELKLYYYDTVQFIKSRCKLLKKGSKKYWISLKVFDELKAKGFNIETLKTTL